MQFRYRLIPVEGAIVAGTADISGPGEIRARAQAALGTHNVAWCKVSDGGLIKDMGSIRDASEEPLNPRATTILRSAKLAADPGHTFTIEDAIFGPAYIVDSGRVDAHG